MATHPPHADHDDQGHPSLGAYWGVFVALIGLLAVTVAAAEVNLGEYGLPLALAIATIKAVLILLFFMHLRYSSALVWLFAAAGFYWLAILLALTLGDYFTRGQ